MDLEWWNKNCFGNVKRDLEERKKSLERAETKARRIGINTQVRELKAEINVLLDREIRMWSQRSRVLWLSKGDSNSKHFHSKATHKHLKYTILGIRDIWGRWQDQPNGIGKTLIDFYGELFTTSSPVLLLKTLGYVPQMVSIEVNSHLIGEFMAWEVHKALKQMALLKASGPDRMLPLFFQHF